MYIYAYIFIIQVSTCSATTYLHSPKNFPQFAFLQMLVYSVLVKFFFAVLPLFLRMPQQYSTYHQHDIRDSHFDFPSNAKAAKTCQTDDRK